VRGGTGARLTRDQERAARLEVSARLGHAREAITTAYCGKKVTARTTPARKTPT